MCYAILVFYVARNYLNRLGLSVDGKEFLAALNSVPCASGFSLNLGNLASLTVANVEVWSGGTNVFQVSGYNYHFNMYVCTYMFMYMIQCLLFQPVCTYMVQCIAILHRHNEYLK